MLDDSEDDRDRRAAEAAEAMMGRDRASRELGIEIQEIRAGYARMTMSVRPWMLQGIGVCHGGLLFTLADTAMAFASNSHGETHVSTGGTVEFLRPGEEGQTLTAEATELHRSRRTAVYDVRVTADDGKVVCHFRGRTLTAQAKR